MLSLTHTAVLTIPFLHENNTAHCNQTCLPTSSHHLESIL